MLLDYFGQYICVGYYNRVLLYGRLFKPVYLKTRILTLILQFWEALLEVLGSIAQICGANRKMKHKRKREQRRSLEFKVAFFSKLIC